MNWIEKNPEVERPNETESKKQTGNNSGEFRWGNKGWKARKITKTRNLGRVKSREKRAGNEGRQWGKAPRLAEKTYGKEDRTETCLGTGAWKLGNQQPGNGWPADVTEAAGFAEVACRGRLGLGKKTSLPDERALSAVWNLVC